MCETKHKEASGTEEEEIRVKVKVVCSKTASRTGQTDRQCAVEQIGGKIAVMATAAAAAKR